MKQRILSLLVLLMAAVSGAWAQDNRFFLEVSGTSATLKWGEPISNDNPSFSPGSSWKYQGNDWTDKSGITTITVDASCTNCSAENISALFYNFVDLQTINNIENIKTDAVKYLGSMFHNCTSLQTLDLSSWNTENVTSMNGMFRNCTSLQTLDISSFNTGNVNGMGYMFKDCSTLTTIYVGDGWSTDQLTSSSSSIEMFDGCVSLPNWNTDNPVIDKTNAHTGDGGYLTYKASTDYELTVHDSKAISNSSIPFYGSYMNNYTRNEMIYPAAELAVMSGADITSLTFYKDSGITESWGAASFKIYLMEVSNSTLSAYIGMTGATVVYEGSVDATGGERPVTINFTTPYRYNGGNLLVGVYQTVKGSESFAAFYGQLVSSDASSGSYDSQDAASAPFSQQDFLPKTTFTYKPAPFDYELTVEASDHGSGTIKFFIDEKEVEGAYETDEGKTVTVKVTPDEGWWVADPFAVTAEVYRYWEGSRRAQATVPMQRTVNLKYERMTLDGVAIYTFTMPASNVKVKGAYKKISTLYFDPADRTNLMQVKVDDFPVNLDGNDKTVKIEKEEDILEGKPVTLTANTGYKFRKVEVKKGTAEIITDLSTLTAAYEAQDGEILAGTTSQVITIKDGATVKLKGANIRGGIICSGNANIILADGSANVVNVTEWYSPGIKIGPENTTLTIDAETAGTGTLTAKGGYYAAGIGNADAENSTAQEGGHITINGGTIYATGGTYAAGIGTGNGKTNNNECGNIKINGGTVIATGGQFAAGIGTGYVDNQSTNKCGDITIGTGVKKVKATRGGDMDGYFTVYCIGKGAKDSGTQSCGTITIGGETKAQSTFNVEMYTYTPSN